MTEKTSSTDLTDEEILQLVKQAEQEERDGLLRHFQSGEELLKALRQGRSDQE